MKTFLLNVLLAVLWMLMWGSFDIYTLVAGLVVGYLMLGMVGRAKGRSGYGTQFWRFFAFLLYFIRILVVANWQVAKIVLSPRMPIAPRILRYDVSGLSDVEITALANSITLTPGTLSTDLSRDGRWLYIHCINAPDREQAVRELDDLRRRLREGVFE